MTDLLPAESARLAELEAIVTDGLNTFVTVGRALAEIRDTRLYRQSHETFEAFCRDQWGLTRTRAYELISASEIAEQVSEISDIAPTKEGQAKELRGLPAETAAEVMRTAHETTAGKVTASAIKQAREVVAPKADPWAARIAAELAASDEQYREQAAAPEPAPEPSPAVTDWIESSQAVQDSGYLRKFFATLARADDFLLFDAERLGQLLDNDGVDSINRYADSIARFAETVRRSRSGLRVINGGH